MSVISHSVQEQIQDMQATVRLLQEELEATNREVMLLTLELEQRVADRTEALSQSNLDLQKEIAERIRAEAEIKKLNSDLALRAELLEATNDELEMFSASVSHDLRNPLGRVLGYAALLADSTESRISDNDRQYLKKIDIGGRQMCALIEDLLRLSHAAHVELVWGTVDLNQVVRSAIEDLEPEIRGRNIDWTRPDLPPVAGDASLLKQVFANLVSNALKYTRPRDPAQIAIMLSAKGVEECVISVSDNGVGFNPQCVNKLFGAFQRLHSRQQFEGTGIGLTTVRRIILRHGGKVWAEGQPDRGATFSFTLPLRRPNSSTIGSAVPIPNTA